MDLEDNYGLAGFRKATDLKKTHPHLKVTLAIGGWNGSSQNYSMMARDQNKRKKFAASALSFIRRHNFDGFDLDWEYPGKRGGVPEDKKNFVELIRDLKTGHNAPLRSDPYATGNDREFSVVYTWQHLQKKGAIASKTVMGVPFYGRTFNLVNP